MLWKKESDAEDAVYVDLLGSPSIARLYEDYQRPMNLFSMLAHKSTDKASVYRLKGNEMFAEEKWADATECYNKSLCFAEEGSEQMGLAYANRSSCFFKMKMYAKCLIDIDNAKLNNYPTEKVNKLDKRMETCLSMMEKEADQSEMFEPKLDYEPNGLFPCFADVLKIEQNSKYGRHIVAKEDIAVGKTVMVDQSYFAETMKQKYQRCGICSRMAENLKPCNKCVFTLLCPKCEGNNLHDVECSINPSFFGTSKFFSYRMVVVRSILIAMGTFHDADQLIAAAEEMLLTDAVEVPESLSDPRSKYRAFFMLQHNPKEHGDNDLPQKIYLIRRLLMGIPDVKTFFHSEIHKRFLFHLIGHHIVVIKNWIQNDSHLDHIMGVELFFAHRMSIAASYFNHSCAPNAYIDTQNGINICVIVRPVRRGQQLCVAYNAKAMLYSKAERQAQIWSKFNFQCCCDRCEHLQPDSSSLQSDPRIQSDLNFQSLINAVNSSIHTNHNYDNILALKGDAIRLLTKYEETAWCNEILRIIFMFYVIGEIEKRHVSGPMLAYIN